MPADHHKNWPDEVPSFEREVYVMSLGAKGIRCRMIDDLRSGLEAAKIRPA